MKITLCGSLMFQSEFIRASEELLALGLEPLMPDFFDDERAASGEVILDPKLYNFLIENHAQRIRNSDAILVINGKKNGIAGYIGANTILEIGIAYCLKLPIYLLRAMDSQSSRDVVYGTLPKILNEEYHRLKQ